MPSGLQASLGLSTCKHETQPNKTQVFFFRILLLNVHLQRASFIMATTNDSSTQLANVIEEASLCVSDFLESQTVTKDTPIPDTVLHGLQSLREATRGLSVASAINRLKDRFVFRNPTIVYLLAIVQAYLTAFQRELPRRFLVLKSYLGKLIAGIIHKVILPFYATQHSNQNAATPNALVLPEPVSIMSLSLSREPKTRQAATAYLEKRGEEYKEDTAKVQVYEEEGLGIAAAYDSVLRIFSEFQAADHDLLDAEDPYTQNKAASTVLSCVKRLRVHRRAFMKLVDTLQCLEQYMMALEILALLHDMHFYVKGLLDFMEGGEVPQAIRDALIISWEESRSIADIREELLWTLANRTRRNQMVMVEFCLRDSDLEALGYEGNKPHNQARDELFYAFRVPKSLRVARGWESEQAAPQQLPEMMATAGETAPAKRLRLFGGSHKERTSREAAPRKCSLSKLYQRSLRRYQRRGRRLRLNREPTK